MHIGLASIGLAALLFQTEFGKWDAQLRQQCVIVACRQAWRADGRLADVIPVSNALQAAVGVDSGAKVRRGTPHDVALARIRGGAMPAPSGQPALQVCAMLEQLVL